MALSVDALLFFLLISIKSTWITNWIFSYNSEGQDERRREEQRKYGVFFDDDYDYLQHLKEASGPSELVPSVRGQQSRIIITNEGHIEDEIQRIAVSGTSLLIILFLYCWEKRPVDKLIIFNRCYGGCGLYVKDALDPQSDFPTSKNKSWQAKICWWSVFCYPGVKISYVLMISFSW